MRKSAKIVIILLLVACSFLAGYWFSQGPSGKSAGGRRILYYVDPMNPGHRSYKPGLAPCGMQLEPVYADAGGTPMTAQPGAATMPPGTVHISTEREQLVGVKSEIVEKTPWSRTVRIPGKVVADENRVFRITAATDGWVTRVLPNTTDSLVRKNQLLATYYTTELFTAMKAYVYALNSLARLQQVSANDTKEQIGLNLDNLENYKNALRNMGMSEHQLDEIQRTRKGTNSIEIRAPGSGVILSRDLSAGQRIEKGAELYRIADLSRIWIMADIFDDAAFLGKPGMQVRISSPHLKRSFHARLTNIPPKFDAVTRTLKLRMEADNPGYLLRPDMFVDVEFSVRTAPAITVPVDAVLDSGLKKTVFVVRGNGFFEPRSVETGRYADERVEIVSGLNPGERIVVSGNFLIDSESRMKSASSGRSGTGSIDPACGMMVDEGTAKAAGLISEQMGKKYFFCSVECKQKFDKSPGGHKGKPPKMEMNRTAMGDDGHHHD
jgi:RND family efflux transporter MFP subunit